MVAAMKIDRVETWVLEAEGQAIEFGAGNYSTFKAMVVAITTDDGITGWGGCIARRGPQGLGSVVRDLLWPGVKGRDPPGPQGPWARHSPPLLPPAPPPPYLPTAHPCTS